MPPTIRKVTEAELQNAEGRCYICAFRYMAKIPDDEAHRYRLVHGDVIDMRDPSNVVQYGHAWVEKDKEFVIELRHDLRRKPLIMPIKSYYEYFHVVEETIKRYSKIEMWLTGQMQGGNFGPWRH